MNYLFEGKSTCKYIPYESDWALIEFLEVNRIIRVYSMAHYRYAITLDIDYPDLAQLVYVPQIGGEYTCP